MSDYFIPFTLAALVLLLLLLLYFIRRNRALVLSNESTQVEMASIQKKADIAAKEADHAKDIFLANISHETRTPMNAIIGLSHILLQSPLNETQKRDVEKIKHSAEKLLSVTNDMLDISQIKADKLTIETSTIEMNSLVASLAHVIDQNAIKKGVELLFDTAIDLPETFQGDALHISQVLVNLLNNAIKFTAQGVITLRITRQEGAQGEELCFDVIDTGVGLSKEQIAKLFHAFDKTDETQTRAYDGNGLGLTISKELVEHMGGRLIVTSALKQGSTFSFILPLLTPTELNEPLIKRYKRLIHKREILIFELSSKTAQLLSDRLSSFGADVQIITTEHDLQSHLKTQRYDALFITPKILRVLQEPQSLERRCDHIILLENSYEASSECSFDFRAKLLKPITTLTLLEAMHDVFTHTIVKNPVKEEAVTIEDIASLRGAKILLAEDNEGNAMVVEGLLKESGLSLTVVTNGQKAVEEVFKRSSSFDLLLMDINMPVMNGYTATSMIREYAQFDTLPIIAMTANITESDVNKSKQLGMQAHLAKPIDTNKFYKTLLEFINTKETSAVIQAPKEHKSENSFDSLLALGINVEDALMRLNQNSTTYIVILKKFASMFRDVDTTFIELYEAIQLDQGHELAHNLKGSAGNIGAKEIYRLAADIEACFKGESVDFSLDIKKLSTLLHPFIDAIDALEEPSDECELKAIETTEVVALLKRIYIAAKERRALEIKKGFEKLVSYAWPENYEKQISQLEDHIRAYKFDMIRLEIEKIMQAIKAANGKIV